MEELLLQKNMLVLTYTVSVLADEAKEAHDKIYLKAKEAGRNRERQRWMTEDLEPWFRHALDKWESDDEDLIEEAIAATKASLNLIQDLIAQVEQQGKLDSRSQTHIQVASSCSVMAVRAAAAKRSVCWNPNTKSYQWKTQSTIQDVQPLD